MRNILLSGLIGVLLGTAVQAQAVETIRPEDEKLLEGLVQPKAHVKAETPVVTEEKAPIIPEDDAPEIPFDEAPFIQENWSYPVKPTVEPIESDSIDIRGLTTIKTDTPPVSQERFMHFRDEISACLDLQKEQLDLEEEMMYSGNVYEGTAYLTQTLASVHTCYQNIGYQIIDELYHGDEKVRRKYENKINDFIVKGSEVTFDSELCGEFCKVKALVLKQREKFADFRTYLAKLIAERGL